MPAAAVIPWSAIERSTTAVCPDPVRMTLKASLFDALCGLPADMEDVEGLVPELFARAADAWAPVAMRTSGMTAIDVSFRAEVAGFMRYAPFSGLKPGSGRACLCPAPVVGVLWKATSRVMPVVVAPAVPGDAVWASEALLRGRIGGRHSVSGRWRSSGRLGVVGA